MSDSYIPELIELSSFWQNAVDEAMEDTLKGEKRLYYALKNREKIKDKLQKLGVKPNTFGSNSEDKKLYPGHKNRFSVKEQENTSQESLDSAEDGFLSPMFLNQEKSRSGSRTREETPHKYPDRPLFGEGSLEKIKKSQNDFNYEAMGRYEQLMSLASESEGGCVLELGTSLSESTVPNKEIQWLHVGKNSVFEDSESGSSKGQLIENSNVSEAVSCLGRNIREDDQKVPINLDPRGDVFWENEVKSAIRATAYFERKLQFALAKQDILNEHQLILRIEDGTNEIEIDETDAKNIEKRQRGIKFLSPFVQFYLDVYRELCFKKASKEIGEEAAKRWSIKATDSKARYFAKKVKK